MMTDLIPYEEQPSDLQIAGQAANQAAASGIFADYHARRSTQTLRSQRADLRSFADFLWDAGLDVDGDDLQIYAGLWLGMTWGIVEAYKTWLIERGYAVGTVNQRLSTVRSYARLAFKAGYIDQEEHQLIQSVQGYSRAEGKRLDENRDQTRVGRKKAEPTRLSIEDADRLKHDQPDTPQGRRDALMMCLLLDHGLRCGEVALIQVDHINLKTGLLEFYRPKVDKEQTHRLTRDTLRAASAYYQAGDAPPLGRLLRSSRRDGSLGEAGITERAITKRVRVLGREIGIEPLSAHDLRHYWATHAARAGTDPFALQEAGGWSSLAMPRRYVEDARIANDGVLGFDDD